jgi:serine-type D-Ala-D-Ala carboxypeptidase (penicillin-binding protein 5/6)
VAGLAPAGLAEAAPNPPADLPADSWLLVDEGSGDVLAEHDADAARPIASATKLMTAYIVLRRLDLDEEVTAPEYAAVPGESLMGLRAGEVVSVRDLLYGLLIASGNDAATALALRVSGSIPDFVALMNRTASKLGLGQTNYVDPIGLDGGNVSSARDLASLATRLRRDRLFRKIVDTERITVGSGEDEHRLENRNTLVLEEPFVNGVKTGTTLAAGYVLVGSGEQRGIDLVSAVLGTPGEAERDAATLELLDYGFSLYRERALVERGERLAAVTLSDGRGRLPLVAGAELAAVARADQRVDVDFEAPESPDGAVARGEDFGTAIVTLDGEEVGEVPVVAARTVAAPEETGLPDWAWIVFAVAGAVALALAGTAVVVARRPPR